MTVACWSVVTIACWSIVTVACWSIVTVACWSLVTVACWSVVTVACWSVVTVACWSASDEDWCKGDPCSGHGNCTDGLLTFTCQCEAPYTGDKCDKGMLHLHIHI